MATGSNISTRVTKQELAAENRLQKSVIAIHQAAATLAERQAEGMPLQNILNELVRECADALQADIFCIMLLSPDGASLTIPASVGLDVHMAKPIPVSDRAALTALIQKEFTTFSKSTTGACLPLTFQDLPLGAICITRSAGTKALHEAERAALRHVANQLAATVFMYGPARDIVEMERTERDMQLAHSLCRSFSPRLPRTADFRIDVQSIRCVEFGGDFHDIVALAEGRTAFVVGETSGMGLKAALNLTRLNVLIRGLLARQLPIADVLTELNRELVSTPTRGHLVSLCLIELNPAKHTLRIARAGSTQVYLAENGSVQRLTTAICPQLGMLSMIHPAVTEIALKPGASLLIMTDGFNKIQKHGQPPFSASDMEHVMLEPATVEVSLSLRLSDAIGDYLGADVLQDDLTLFSIECLS